MSFSVVCVFVFISWSVSWSVWSVVGVVSVVVVFVVLSLVLVG